MIEHMFVSDLLAQVTAGVSGLLSEDWDAYSEGALSEHLAAVAEQLERMHAADRMASDKLAEGIAGFTKALETLEEILAARLKVIEG